MGSWPYSCKSSRHVGLAGFTARLRWLLQFWRPSRESTGAQKKDCQTRSPQEARLPLFPRYGAPFLWQAAQRYVASGSCYDSLPGSFLSQRENFDFFLASLFGPYEKFELSIAGRLENRGHEMVLVSSGAISVCG